MDDDFWNPINFNEKPSFDMTNNTNGNGSTNNGSMIIKKELIQSENESTKQSIKLNETELINSESNSTMDSTRQIDCEVLIDENPANKYISLNDERIPKKHYKSGMDKYYRIAKKELASLVVRKDPSISFKNVKSRKTELVNNYERILVNGQETEFVKCMNCKDLLCYSSYDGTTSVSRHLMCCTKLKANQSGNQALLRKRVISQINPQTNSQINSQNQNLSIKSNHITNKPQVIYIKQVPSSAQSKQPVQINYSPKMNNEQFVNNNSSKNDLIVKASKTNQFVKFANDSVVKEEIIKMTTKTIFSCLLPFNFFDEKRIKDFFQKLITIGSQYGNLHIDEILPNKEEAKKSLKLYVDKIEKKLKAELDDLDSITLLIDDYRCKSSNKLYSVLAVQYSKEGCLKNRLLAVKQDPHYETKKNRKEFKDYLNIYDLNDTETVTSTNPKDHFNEEDSNKLTWLNCSLNQLNQVLESMINSLEFQPTLQEIAYFCQKCPAVLDFFKNNGIQINSNLNDNSMVQHSFTNIKLNHEMFYEALDLIKQHEKLVKTDSNLITILDQTDLAFLENIRCILNNFYGAKKYISSENSTTINLILPCFKKLDLILDIEKETDYRIKDFKCLMINLLRENFSVTDKHKIATFLTPRFRSLRNLCSPTETENLIKKIKQELSDEKSESMKAKKEEDNFFEFCKTNVDEIGECDKEVENYLKHNLNNQDLSEDPLKFWEKNKEIYPKLSLYSADILSVPASCTGFAEKLFVKNNLDSRLAQIQEHLNDYLFINSNVDLLE